MVAAGLVRDKDPSDRFALAGIAGLYYPCRIGDGVCGSCG